MRSLVAVNCRYSAQNPIDYGCGNPAGMDGFDRGTVSATIDVPDEGGMILR